MRREQAARSGKIAVTKISIPEVRLAKVGTGEGASPEISATQVAAGKILAVPFHTVEIDPMSVCVFEGMIVRVSKRRMAKIMCETGCFNQVRINEKFLIKKG